jgi:hypothetical protein
MLTVIASDSPCVVANGSAATAARTRSSAARTASAAVRIEAEIVAVAQLDEQPLEIVRAHPEQHRRRDVGARGEQRVDRREVLATPYDGRGAAYSPAR